MLKLIFYKITFSRIKTLSLLFLFLRVFNGFCQDYDIKTIKVNNNNFSVYLPKKLHLDNDGFLWYSTKNGIVKEMGNGKSFFFEYAFDKEKYNQILTTTKLFRCSQNKLWSCTDKGLNCLDLKTGTSKWIELNYPETNNNVIFTDIVEDALGNIWLGTDRNYIYRYTPNDNILSYKLNDSVLISKHQDTRMKITTIPEDNSLIINQNNKWIQFKNEQSKLLQIEKDSQINKKSLSRIVLPNGALFDSNTSGFYKYKDETYYYTYIEKINRQVLNIPFEDAQFISKKASKNFYHSLNIIATDLEQLLGLKMIKTDSKYELILEDSITFKHRITNVIYDPNGYFWLHTEDGLQKIRYNDIGFKKYIDKENISCRGFVENSKGVLYVYTHQGIFKKEKNAETFQEIKNIKDINTYEIIKNQSYGFYNQNNKVLWFYGHHSSLIAFDIEKGTFENYPLDISKATIFDDAFIDNNLLLLATTKGLYSFNLKSKLFKNKSILNDTIDLNNESINCITLSKDKNILWLGTSGKKALIRQDLKTKKVAVFNNLSKTLPLVDNNVKVIHEDYDSNLWIGTNNGLQLVNPKTYAYTNFTSLNGFTSENIAGILEDKKNMWVSTFNGLVKVNKTTQAVQTYYEVDGLTHNEFNAKSYYKSSDNLFYFGGLNGITSFNPNDIANKSKNYKILLTDYQLFDENLKKNISVKTLLDEDKTIKEFSIPYQQNYLTLNFSINDLFNAENNVYQYRIKELSEDWIHLGSYSKLELRGMNPGRYTLEVHGFSSNGNPTNILQYKINIKQIFYKELWFIALNIFTVFGFITIRNYWRRTRLEKEFELKGKIQALESKAMRAQMNPHFIFNTLNGMQSVMLLKGEREANKYFTAFSKLLRLTLDMSNSEYVLLKNEILYLRSYLNLENLRLNNKINIEFNVDSNLDTDNNSIPCMLFQPIIENAIIHGLSPKKKNLNLIIDFKKEDKKLLAEIIDNGIGRAEAMKIKENSNNNHKSWATHIMTERIEMTNAINHEKITWKVIDLEDENGESQGTKVVIRIPLKEKSFLEKTE